jgi:hypothetical protein
MATSAPSSSRPLPGSPRVESCWRRRPSPVLVRTEPGQLRRYPPRLESDGSVAGGRSAVDVDQAGLPAELELRVFGNGQYYGRFLMGPGPGARPALQARLVAVALAEQVGHAYSAARVSRSAR